MPKRIEKLTKKQEAIVPEWRDKWIKIGLSTERADRPRFERAVAGCYRAAKLVPPKTALAAPLATAVKKTHGATKPGRDYLAALEFVARVWKAPKKARTK